MAVSAPFIDQRFDHTMTRWDRALATLTQLMLSRPWRTAVTVVGIWAAACTATAGYIVWRLGPHLWARLPHSLQVRMIDRYLTAVMAPTVLILGTLVLGALVFGAARAPRPGRRTVSVRDSGLCWEHGRSPIELPWNVITDLRWVGWAVLARVGRESLAVIPARALGGFRRAGAGYREMRALWERRRADDGGGTLAPAFFLATHETLEAGRNCLGLTGRMRPWAAYTALGLVLATVWAAAWAITSGDPIAAPVTFLLAGAAGSFAMRQEPSQQFARRMCEGQGDFTPMAVRVGEDALVETTALGERRYRWDQVREIMEGRFVIVFRTGDAEAVVVPRRAFRSTRDADLFHRTAETYRFAALGEAAVWPPLPRSAAAAPAPGGE